MYLREEAWCLAVVSVCNLVRVSRKMRRSHLVLLVAVFWRDERLFPLGHECRRSSLDVARREAVDHAWQHFLELSR